MSTAAIPLTQAGLIFEALGLAPAMIDGYVQEVAQRCRNQWQTYAQRELTSSRQAYVAGLQAVQMSNGTAAIALLGRFANMVENGWEGGNLRDTMLKPGTKNLRVAYDKKTGQAWFYLRIPFRHATPDAGAEMAPPMGAAYANKLGAVEARKLGMAVHNIVKAKEFRPTLSRQFDGVSQRGDRVSALDGGPLLRARHVTGIYAGMIKQSKAYAAATQSSYTTFRTISNNPDSERKDEGGRNWDHPGIEPRDFAGRAADYVARTAGETLVELMTGTVP